MSNSRARSLRRMRERRAVAALEQLLVLAHDAAHLLMLAAESCPPDVAYECRRTAHELAEALVFPCAPK